MNFMKLARGLGLGLALAAGALFPLHDASAQTKVKIGYIPVLGSAQLFVIDGQGWAKDEGLDLELIRFQAGTQAIQALAAGQLDAYLAGVLPLLVARSKGVDVRVVAAAAIEELQLVGRGLLLAATEGADFKTAIANFTATQGRKPKIAAQPQGSVPDTLLRYWLQVENGIDPSSVDITGLDIDAAQQAFLAGSVDAAVLREPALTVVRDRVKDSKVLVTGHQFMPDQPGSVLALYKPGEPQNAATGEKLLRLHLRATELIKAHPDQAAPFILKALGSGILTPAQIDRALAGSLSSFVTDPARIVDSVEKLQAFEIKLGTVKNATPVADLFDLAFYQRVAAAK
ncbi:ABC-type nitrate/sulfonate/bicarbonate transport systems periplasmic components-like protein [Methylocella silvestris BL2]|uniref:ABC-type nitrate/sulfonate/bicarbonate transport systems periplasmic components-like protein n=2 Tax=Methylocella silvestris TaxID=199596 RepID=B8EKK6_METSB|nr:ABC-type nitrate/sulfonate/bicarbonate transport systems periplasmic components-like protein [Methylocella silvestris BL2]